MGTVGRFGSICLPYFYFFLFSRYSNREFREHFISSLVNKNGNSFFTNHLRFKFEQSSFGLFRIGHLRFEGSEIGPNYVAVNWYSCFIKSSKSTNRQRCSSSTPYLCNGWWGWTLVEQEHSSSIICVSVVTLCMSPVSPLFHTESTVILCCMHF